MPYVYNEHGYVADWGPPNFHYYPVDVTVSAWNTLQVSIWWNRPSNYWRESLFFHVERWSDIPHHYNFYFLTSGETCDIVFVVDCCIWSELYGWEYGCGSERTTRELYGYECGRISARTMRCNYCYCDKCCG